MPFSGQPIELLAFQRYAIPLFAAYKPPLTQKITANVKGLINSVALAIELAPSAVWGEPLHDSGLFSVLVDHLAEEKVNYNVLSPGDGKPRLTQILQLSATILVEHILLFSRIAVVDVQAFVALVAGAARLKGVPDTEIWGVIMNQWWNRVSLGFAGVYIVHRW